MKNEYCKPEIKLISYDAEKEIAALNLSTNPLDWGTGSNSDSVLWE